MSLPGLKIGVGAHIGGAAVGQHQLQRLDLVDNQRLQIPNSTTVNPTQRGSQGTENERSKEPGGWTTQEQAYAGNHTAKQKAWSELYKGKPKNPDNSIAGGNVQALTIDAEPTSEVPLEQTTRAGAWGRIDKDHKTAALFEERMEPQGKNAELSGAEVNEMAGLGDMDRPRPPRSKNRRSFRVAYPF